MNNHFKFSFLSQEEFSWLINSDLYLSFQNLNEDSDEEFPEFIYCSKYTDDIMLYLNVIRFWGIDEPPKEFYDLLFTIKLDIDNIYKFNLNDIEEFKVSEEDYANLNPEKIKYLKKFEQIGHLTNEIDEFCKNSNGKIFVFLSKLLEFSKIKTNICKYASEFGILSCLKWAFENECPWDEMTCLRAAQNGHLECLKYAHEHGCPWNEAICVFAAENGDLDCLKYLHENGCPWDELTCILASENGHLDCLKYAHENGCPWDENVCIYAAKNGYLDCLKYAHENECSWNKETCTNAACYGKIDCLKYAHENGCSWDVDTCRYAANYRHLDCLNYAYENKCPGYERYFNI